MSARAPRPFGWLRAAVSALAMTGVLLAPLSVAHAQQGDTPSLIRDTEIEAILHQECDPVFAAAGLDPKLVQIHIIADREMNAETGAGYDMFVTTSLIMQTENPNQLIGVMAHETGHMAGGHIARSGDMGHAAMGPMMLGIGLGILAAIAGAPDAAAGLIYSSSYFAQLNVLAYSRVQEAQADQAAITYLERAGMSSQGLVEFFNNFRAEELYSNAKKYPYFQSHPLSDDRIESLTRRANQQAHWGAKDTPEAIALHEIMKAKLKGFINPPAQTYLDYPPTDQSFPARYARAIAYYRDTDTAKALTAIDALTTDQPNNPYLWELKGQVLFEAGRPAEAEPAHRRAVQLKPEAPLLRIMLGQALIAQDNPDKLNEAIVVINRAMIVEPDDPLGWRLLSEAYDSKGEAGMARLATAEQDFYLGQMQEARTFALRARELLSRDTPEWRRATDIFLASKPSPEEVKEMGRQG